MITREYLILAPEGMHARPATAMVKLAKQFQVTVLLKKGEKKAKLNSLLSILSLGIKGGEGVALEFEGTGEAAAAEAFDTFFANNLKDW
ncbi:HPr family phosphocarrier protein [Puia sp.]|uniref:HPr family phosphocarrier protein n=1 Tax=Puia sp. TaxID=2045100 RepID=UPI002F411DFF